ncbi:MAG: hypothetical protein KatS3mg108_0255 [Isosphaeraceae bacterium]|jgi:quercetin dioxygenase-like cupin family protein|nr:MAG: hypothetical protein KatS3mg108_0255 [Isosphaeraceae bacterium]
MAPDGPRLPQTETSSPIVCRPGEGTRVVTLAAETTIKVRPDQTAGAYAILEQLIPADHGPPLHVHRHETEVFYILEGQFEITLGSQRQAAPPGSLVVAPPDIPHTFHNVGPSPGRLLLTIIPGRFAGFFLDSDGVDPNDRATLKTLCARYDVQILA